MNDQNIPPSASAEPPPDSASPVDSSSDSAPAGGTSSGGQPESGRPGGHSRHRRRRRRGRRGGGGQHPSTGGPHAFGPAGSSAETSSPAISAPTGDSSPAESPATLPAGPASPPAVPAEGGEPSAPSDEREGQGETAGSHARGQAYQGDSSQRRRRRRRGGRRHRRQGGEPNRPQTTEPQTAPAAPVEGAAPVEPSSAPAETPAEAAAQPIVPAAASEAPGETPAPPPVPVEAPPRPRERERPQGRPRERGGRGEQRGERRGRGGDRGHGDRFQRWTDRSRRETRPGETGVVQGHSTGWSSARNVSFDDALMSPETGTEAWGTDQVTQQKDQVSQEQNWNELNEEITQVETVGSAGAAEAAPPPPSAEPSSVVEPQVNHNGNHAELGLEDEGETPSAGQSASPHPDPSAVVDAARDAEGEVIHAPAPLSAEAPSAAVPEVEEPLGNKVMLINVAEGDECRLAILDGDLRLDELYTERVSTVSHVGNIYKGIVTNIERSIQAAFVDLGLEKSGFLHISDLQPQYFMSGRNGRPMLEDVGRKLSRRERPPIQDCLRRGQEIVVQIIKEGIGTKGPTLTSYVSIPGRYLVLMPGMTRLGVSRKVEDENERRQARQALEQLNPPDDLGFIIRTQGVGRNRGELQRDLEYLMRLWSAIEKRIHGERGPNELFRESDLIIRTLRDVYTRSIGRILVDSEEVASRAREFLSIVDPEAAMAVEYYREKYPLFHRFHIEEEITRIHDRRVPLPAGGGLVIDATEALVAIDVNSGKSRQQQDAEETAYRTNLEAAVEIARQLRLRDLGGVIICDFIDMRHERHRLAVERCLFEAMRKDRARTKVLPISRFGIIEMTRQRMRPSLKRTLYQDCPCCKSTGLIKTSESVCLDVLRNVRQMLHFMQVAGVEITVHPDVAYLLLNQKRKPVMRLEIETGKHVVIRSHRDFWPDQIQYTYTDRSGKVTPVEESFIHQHGSHGPVHATPVGPIGEAIKPSTIHGPKVVGFEPVTAEEEVRVEAEEAGADQTDTIQPLPTEPSNGSTAETAVEDEIEPPIEAPQAEMAATPPAMIAVQETVLVADATTPPPPAPSAEKSAEAVPDADSV